MFSLPPSPMSASTLLAHIRFCNINQSSYRLPPESFSFPSAHRDGQQFDLMQEKKKRGRGFGINQGCLIPKSKTSGRIRRRPKEFLKIATAQTMQKLNAGIKQWKEAHCFICRMYRINTYAQIIAVFVPVSGNYRKLHLQGKNSI